MQFCGCDIQIQSVVAVSDESEAPVISDEHASAWESLYVPLLPSVADPNQAPTELAPSTPLAEEGEAPSMPETPHLEPDQGASRGTRCWHNHAYCGQGSDDSNSPTYFSLDSGLS